MAYIWLPVATLFEGVSSPVFAIAQLHCGDCYGLRSWGPIVDCGMILMTLKCCFSDVLFTTWSIMSVQSNTGGCMVFAMKSSSSTINTVNNY